MTPPPSKYLDSDFSGLVLGNPPKELTPTPVSLPGVNIPKPGSDSKDFYSTALGDGSLKGYVDGAQSDPVAYLDAWRKNWWETDPEKYRKDHMARDVFLTAAFVLYHQSTKPEEKTKILNIFLKAAKDSFETLQALKKDNSIHYMSEGYRRLSLAAGAMLGDLKGEKTGEEAQTQILTLLRDASQFVSTAIPTESNEYRHVRLYTQARASLLSAALTPPTAGESRKKLAEITTSLQGAKEAAEKVDAAYLKNEFIPLIDADLNFLPKKGAELPLAREFMARQTANFVMMMASEIDLTDGDGQGKVQERYKTLTQSLESVFSQNPGSSFKEALEKVSTPEAAHLKNLIEKNSALQDLKGTEELALLQGTDNLKASDFAAKWSSAVLDVVDHHTGFSLGGAKNLASFREILNQFIKSSGGTAPSPFSQSFQEFTGVTPSAADEASARATKRFFALDSSGFKVMNGVGRFVSMENLLFIGVAGALNRVGSSLLIRRAGAEGTLGALVKEGQLTGWGHFAVGTGVGATLSLGFAGTQYFKDLSADRPDAGGNFFRNFAMGLVINTAALGLSFAGSAVLRNRMMAQEARLLEAGGPPPSAGRLFFNRTVVPYMANLAIGSGGMLATNGIFRMYHNAAHPGQQVPLVTLDEAVETTLTMAALPLAERPMHRLMMNKQLGEYRLKKINAIADTMMEERYGQAGSPSPYGTDRNLQPHVWRKIRSGVFQELALQALRGVEIKHLENPAFQGKIAEKLSMPKLQALGAGASLAQTVITPPPALPPSGLPDGVFRTENNKAVKFTPQSQIEMGQSMNAKVENVENHPTQAGLSIVSIRRFDGVNTAGEVLKVFVPTAELAPFAPNAKGHLKVEDAPALPPPAPAPVAPPPPPRTPSGPIPPLTTVEGAKIQLGKKMVGGMNPAGGPPLAPTRNAGSLYGKVVGADFELHPEGDLKVTLQLEQLNEPGLPQHVIRLDPQKARTMEIQKDAYFPVLNYEPPAGGEPLPRVAPTPAPAQQLPARLLTPLETGVFPAINGDEYFVKKRPDTEPVLPGFIYGKVTEIIPAPQLQNPQSPATVTFTRIDPASGRTGNETFVLKIPQERSVAIGVENNAVFAIKRFYVDDITPPRGIPALGHAWPVEQGVFLGIGDNMPGSPRRHKVKMVFPGVGEAAGFTHEGIDKKMWDDNGYLIPGYDPVNEDAFGMDTKNRVIVVADGMGGQDNGDKASHHGVKAIVDFMQQPGANLGDAFLAGHGAIRSNCAAGACVASAVQIMTDGTVNTAIAGDGRLWILRPQTDGSYHVIEPYLPDTFATVERLYPAKTPQEKLQRKAYYESLMRVTLDERDVAVDNTLSMNASQLNARVRSGLGHLGDVMPQVVSELNYSFNNFGQILHTTVMTADPANPTAAKIPLKLQPGDVLLLMSDGVADLFNRAQMADVVNRKTDVEAMARSVELATLANLNYFQNLAQGAPSGQRVVMIDGRFIDSRGDIYASSDLNDTNLIGHVGPDNITATFFRYSPDVAAQEPAPPSRPTPPDAEFAFAQQSATEPGQAPASSGSKNVFDDPTGQYGVNDLDPAALFADAEKIEPSKVVPNPAMGDPNTTVVNRNFYQQASELFQRIKTKLETDTDLSPSDKYVVLRLDHDSEGALVRRGIDYYTDAPTCAPKQAVLEVKRDASGARTITLAEEALDDLMPQVKQALEETFAVQLTNAHVVKKAVNNGGGATRTEGSGARTIPPSPNDTTAQHQRVDLQIAAAFQNRMDGYFKQLDQGKIAKGNLVITMKDRNLHLSWQPADNLTQKVGEIPALSRHAMTVEITGDVRKDPNAYEVNMSRELDPQSKMARFLQKMLLDLGFQPKAN